MSLKDTSPKSMMVVTEDIGDIRGSWGKWSQRGKTKWIMHS